MPITEADMTPEFARKLFRQFGSTQAAAQAIELDCWCERYSRPASWHSVKRWISSALRQPMAMPDDPDRINRIDDLLTRANIPLESIGGISGARLKAYSGFIKNKDGEPERVPMYSTSIDIVPAAPEWPVIDRPPPVNVTYVPPPNILRKTWSAVVISDVQYGLLVNPETRAVETIHDPHALDVAKQITHDVQPEEWVSIGDWTDWPFLSRWPQHDEFDAANETVRGAHRELAEHKSAAGKNCKRFRVIPSNHGDRPELFIGEKNRKAMRLRRATDTSGWPVFSEPYLLCFDELGIIQEGHYPGGEYYMLPDLVLMHAPPKMREFNASVIHGHTHHLTRKTMAIHGHAGRKNHFIYDIGCLCELGVTSDAHRMMTTRVPSDRARTDWAQGFAVVNVVAGKFPLHAVEQVSIINGRAIYGGKVYGSKLLAGAA